jgi:hypothetical protein
MVDWCRLQVASVGVGVGACGWRWRLPAAAG